MEKIAAVFFEIWNVIASMSLYLLFGFLIAGILHILMPTSFVEQHLSGKGIASSIKAAIIGVPLPICSCGVIPVANSLHKKGADRGAVLSFLTSTPQTGIDSILVTYVMLGWVFTIFRVVIAFVSGIFCGITAAWFTEDKNSDSSSLTNSKLSECCNNQENITPDPSCCPEQPETKQCCSENNGAPQKNLLKMLHYGFIEMPEDLGKTLLIGLLIAGILGAMVPAGFFAQFADNQILSMFAMLIVGIPLYVCSTASVPVALAFIKAGISPGAALVFLIVGPATNAATVSAITQMLGKKSVIIYLLSISICALGAGFMFNSIGFIEEVKETCMSHEIIHWYEHLAGIVLLLILINPVLSKKSHKSASPELPFI